MDGCLLDFAFPSGGVGTAGCDTTATAVESRRQEKKKARRCRGPQATYLNGGMNMVGSIVDPDRQTVRPPPEVPAMNSSTGIRQHAPVSQQYDYETFVGGMDDLSSIEQNVRGQTNLQPMSNSTPSFFGANPADEEPNPVSSRNGLLENFTSSVAPYVDTIGSSNYLLEPDFTKSFKAQGAQKAAGAGLVSG